jgi:hypothetical protein
MTLARRILTEKRHLIYPVVGVLMLNAAVFGAIVYPLSLKVANGERDAQAAATARRTARADYEAAMATVTGKASADGELKKFYDAVLPPDASAARRIVYGRVETLASKVNVKPLRESFEITQEKGSDLAKWTAQIALVGEYRNIRRLIYELETAPEFLVLENVTVAQGDERTPGLNVTVKISTYYRAASNGN